VYANGDLSDLIEVDIVTGLLDMRKSKTFKLDERIISALERLAETSDTTPNNYLETLLFRHCQAQGHISLGEKAPVGGRGGKRPGAGRKAQSAPTDDDQTPEAIDTN
jgi:hypothetical protein